MHTSGVKFYLDNARILASGQEGFQKTEIDIIVHLQAAPLYKSRTSTKYACSMLKQTTRLVARDHRRLNRLISSHGLQMNAVQADYCQMNDLSNVTSSDAMAKCSDNAGSFLQEIFDVKNLQDEHARTILATYSEVTTAQVTRPEEIVTTRSGHPLPTSHLHYFRQKFIAREIDITRGVDPSSCSASSWRKSPMAAIWAGPVREEGEKDFGFGYSALCAAAELRRVKREVVGAVRVLDHARHGVPPVVISSMKREGKNVGIDGKKHLFKKEGVDMAKKKEIFVDEPLSTLPYRMRAMDGGWKKGVWSMGTLVDFGNERMRGGKVLGLKRSSNLNPNC